jgi:ribosome-interacting GTPase 1
MPANLTPEYFKADKWYRSATTNEEKILALEEMLRVIPKHKGTDHMRADLRTKLSKLRDTASKKTGGVGKHVDVFHVPKTGAGQIALVGMPNCGKSSIVGALTKARVHVADFPFATTVPVPGMMKYEDVQIELVDMPPVTADYSAPGQVGTYRHCDLIGLVIDLSGDVAEQIDVCMEYLVSRRLLVDSETGASDDQGNVLGSRGFCICTKCDIADEGVFEDIQEYCDYPFEYVQISAVTCEGMDEFKAKIFGLLNIIRVYTKKPGRDADMADPFTLPRGSTVEYLAKAIHRELGEKLKSARVWGTGVHPGQNVQKSHVLSDKDVVELHFPI